MHATFLSRSFARLGLFRGRRRQRIQAHNQIAPAAAQGRLKASQVIYRHVPGSRLDALQGTQVHLGTPGQNLLRQPGAQAQGMEVVRDNDVRFGRGFLRHRLLYMPGNARMESGRKHRVRQTLLTGRNLLAKTGLPMNATPLRAPLFCPWLAVLLALLPALAHAQDPYATPPPTDPLAGVPVRVLDQQQVEIGTHRITYNRIAPPVFPAPTPTPTTGPTTNATNHGPQTRGVSRSPHTNDAGDGGEKDYKMLLLSATVYDHQFTEVRWNDGAGAELRAYINIDFCYFTTVTNLETADTIYNLMFAWSNDTANSLTQAGQQPPNLAAYPPGRSSYQIIAGDANAHPDALAALDALCIYFDANKAQMVAAYNQREADNAAHQQWLIDHPTAQPDTVMYFWPIKGSAYLNQTH